MLKDAILKSLKEQETNNRKCIHNINCSLDDIQPYDNKAFLELVNAVSKEIES